MLGAAEDVHHVHGLLDRGEIGHDFLAEKLLARMAGIDGYHPIALARQIPAHEMAGAHRIGRNAHAGDGFRLVQNLAQIFE